MLSNWGPRCEFYVLELCICILRLARLLGMMTLCCLGVRLAYTRVTVQ